MGNVPEANKGAACMNNTAIGCKFIGWILLIIGSLLSFVMGVNYGDDVLGIIGAIAIVVGTLLIGIGEIIHLLSKMVNKMTD